MSIMGTLKGNVLKYVSRYKFKGEPLQDLRKSTMVFKQTNKGGQRWGQVKQAIHRSRRFCSRMSRSKVVHLNQTIRDAREESSTG
jgi:hypothetical protein